MASSTCPSRRGTHPWGGHETAPWHYLGGRRAARHYEKRHGRPPSNLFGSSLFACHVGPTLRLARSHPDVDIVDAMPRYYPDWMRWIIARSGRCGRWPPGTFSSSCGGGRPVGEPRGRASTIAPEPGDVPGPPRRRDLSTLGSTARDALARHDDRRFWTWLGAITLVGLGIRLATVLGRPDRKPGGDAYYFHAAANLLVEGHGFIDPW